MAAPDCWDTAATATATPATAGTAWRALAATEWGPSTTQVTARPFSAVEALTTVVLEYGHPVAPYLQIGKAGLGYMQRADFHTTMAQMAMLPFLVEIPGLPATSRRAAARSRSIIRSIPRTSISITPSSNRPI